MADLTRTNEQLLHCHDSKENREKKYYREYMSCDKVNILSPNNTTDWPL